MKIDLSKRKKNGSFMTHLNMNDFEDMLLTRRILKGERLRSLAESELKDISPQNKEKYVKTYRKSLNNTARNSFGLKRKLLNISELKSNSIGNDRLNISTKADSIQVRSPITNSFVLNNTIETTGNFNI